MEKHLPYRAYLIRLWPTKRGGQPGYRVSLESVATRECKDFADLQSLFIFLQAQEEADSEGPGRT